MKIVPGILTSDMTDFDQKVELVKELVEWVHIDMQDGEFIDQSTRDIRKFPDAVLHGLGAEAHLMTYEPDKYLEDCSRMGFKRVIIHLSAMENPSAVLRRIKALHMQPAIALNPEDSVDSLEPYLDLIEAVLIMTINPGPQGQKIMPELLEKSRELRMYEPDIIIGVDGGVKLGNIEMVAEYPLDYAEVGSGLWKTDDVAATLGSLRAKLM